MDRRLLAFGLGNFHVVMFLAPVLLGLHIGGRLDAFVTFGTLAGAAIFLVFWLVTVWATAMGVDGALGGRNAFGLGALFGAIEAFLLVVIAFAAVSFVGGPLVFAGLPFAALVGTVAGALVGLAFAALDLLLIGRVEARAAAPAQPPLPIE